MKRALAVCALVAAFYQAGSAQQPAQPAPTPPPPAEGTPPGAPSQQPVFRTGINFVRVDVIVSDKKGTPVATLTANDFEVLEDGKPQTIEQFRLIKVSGNPEIGDAPPR